MAATSRPHEKVTDRLLNGSRKRPPQEAHGGLGDVPRLRSPGEAYDASRDLLPYGGLSPGGSDCGPRLVEFDGRGYDPPRHYACDRTKAASIWMCICGTISEQRNYKR